MEPPSYVRSVVDRNVVMQRIRVLCDISGFYGNEVRSSLFWGFTQRCVLIVCRRFDKAFRSRLQGDNPAETPRRAKTGCSLS